MKVNKFLGPAPIGSMYGIFAYMYHKNQPTASKYIIWLVVSTHLKNISQNGNLPQVGVKIKNI